MTNRRSKAAYLKKKQKEVLGFWRDLTKIHDKMDKPKRVKLDKPQTLGWKKVWHIRKDRGLLEIEIEALQNHLDNNTYLTWSKKKSRIENRKTPTIKYYVSKKEFKALPTKRVRDFFTKDWFSNNRYYLDEHACKYSFWTEVTHYRVNEVNEVNSELVSKEHFLRKRLFREGQWEKYSGRDFGGHVSDHKCCSRRCRENHYHRHIVREEDRQELNEQLEEAQHARYDN